MNIIFKCDHCHNHFYFPSHFLKKNEKRIKNICFICTYKDLEAKAADLYLNQLQSLYEKVGKDITIFREYEKYIIKQKVDYEALKILYLQNLI